MSTSLPVLDSLRIASPCPVSWDGMAGDERMRFCARCRQPVFNLSAMCRQDAEALIREKLGRLCVRYFQRADGGVMTRDCPEGVARRVRRRLVLALGLCISFWLGLVGWADLLSAGGNRGRGFLLDNYEPFNTVLQWLSPAPRVLMGAPCPPPPEGGGPLPVEPQVPEPD